MKKYLITSNEFSANILHKQFTVHRPEYALYRDKENKNYDVLATEFIETCKVYPNLKSFLHQKVDLAKVLGAQGVHLTSQQFDEISRAKSMGLEVIISTHTHEEVLQAQKLGADAVTYSPVFASPGKGVPKGIQDLDDLLQKVTIKVFALGGIIDEQQIEKLNDSKVYGFASIRFFNL